MKNNGGKEKKRKKQAVNEANVCECNGMKDKNHTCECADGCGDQNSDGGAIIDEDEAENLAEKVTQLEQKLREKDDEILRRAADMDNYRKRLEKEAEDRTKYANQSVVMDFIGVLDNIELTLQYTEDGSQLHQGLELTIKSFKDVLSKYGVKEIDASNGVKFNPAYHEGIMLSAEPDYLNDVITMCVQKGYTLNDRVIRPAKVRVNKI